MTEVARFCPKCMSIDVEDKPTLLLEGSQPEMSCLICGHTFTRAESVAAISGEGFWTIEKIANVVMMTVTRHASGPFLQVMEFVGLLPKAYDRDNFTKFTGYSVDKYAEYLEIRAEMINETVKAMVEGVITNGFNEAAQQHAKLEQRLGKGSVAVPSAQPSGNEERVFGD